jgi:hypothetical protein
MVPDAARAVHSSAVAGYRREYRPLDSLTPYGYLTLYGLQCTNGWVEPAFLGSAVTGIERSRFSVPALARSRREAMEQAIQITSRRSDRHGAPVR